MSDNTEGITKGGGIGVQMLVAQNRWRGAMWKGTCEWLSWQTMVVTLRGVLVVVEDGVQKGFW